MELPELPFRLVYIIDKAVTINPILIKLRKRNKNDITNTPIKESG